MSRQVPEMFPRPLGIFRRQPGIFPAPRGILAPTPGMTERVREISRRQPLHCPELLRECPGVFPQ